MGRQTRPDVGEGFGRTLEGSGYQGRLTSSPVLSAEELGLNTVRLDGLVVDVLAVDDYDTRNR